MSMDSFQVQDAIRFLESERGEVMRLKQSAGIQGITVDFGIAGKDVPAQSEEFPPKLLLLCGEIGIALAFTLYPSNDDSEAPLP